MSLSLASKTLFNSDHLTVVRVQTLKCHYRVSVESDRLTIYGPGVEEEVEFEDLENKVAFTGLSAEAKALLAVLYFEEL